MEAEPEQTESPMRPPEYFVVTGLGALTYLCWNETKEAMVSSANPPIYTGSVPIHATDRHKALLNQTVDLGSFATFALSVILIGWAIRKWKEIGVVVVAFFLFLCVSVWRGFAEVARAEILEAARTSSPGPLGPWQFEK